MARARWTPPRLTRRVFRDLAIYMACFGLMIGLLFPLLAVLLGVPAQHVLRPGFVVATTAAGLLAAGTNHAIARVVVGSQLQELARGMRRAAGKIHEAAYSGDWTTCSVEECSVVIDSPDVIGASADGFNVLLRAFARARAVEDAVRSFSATLADHDDERSLARAALRELLGVVGLPAGTVVTDVDGELLVLASESLAGADELLDAASLRSALAHEHPRSIEVPPGVEVTTTLLRFRPTEVMVVPLRHGASSVGAVVLGLPRPLDDADLRVLELLVAPLAGALSYARSRAEAELDGLTGLLTRRAGDQRLARAVADAASGTGRLSVVILDVDGLKAINDTDGHLAGDELLRRVGRALSGAVRDGAVTYRYGGDEFVAVLPGVAADDVAAVVDRLRADVERADTRLSISLGHATWERGDLAEDLLHRSDANLYRGRRARRGDAPSRDVARTATDAGSG